jgi:hypothetical protein
VSERVWRKQRGKASFLSRKVKQSVARGLRAIELFDGEIGWWGSGWAVLEGQANHTAQCRAQEGRMDPEVYVTQL